jgi:hypothetical protein
MLASLALYPTFVTESLPREAVAKRLWRRSGHRLIASSIPAARSKEWASQTHKACLLAVDELAQDEILPIFVRTNRLLSLYLVYFVWMALLGVDWISLIS